MSNGVLNRKLVASLAYAEKVSRRQHGPSLKTASSNARRSLLISGRSSFARSQTTSRSAKIWLVEMKLDGDRAQADIWGSNVFSNPLKNVIGNLGYLSERICSLSSGIPR